MPQYIKKEGEVIYLLEYPTEKPEQKQFLLATMNDYFKALDKWHKSAVKTPFHDSQKESILNTVWYYFSLDPNTDRFEKSLSEGILIPDGLVIKSVICKSDYCAGDCGSCENMGIFAFIKESKPVEETNEAKMWDEIEQTYFDFYNISDNEDSFNLTAKDITKLLKSKFTVTRK